jgi:hypothetical protein
MADNPPERGVFSGTNFWLGVRLRMETFKKTKAKSPQDPHKNKLARMRPERGV